MSIRAFRALLGHFLKYPKVICESISNSFSLSLGHLGLFVRACVKRSALKGYGENEKKPLKQEFYIKYPKYPNKNKNINKNKELKVREKKKKPYKCPKCPKKKKYLHK